MADTDDSAKSSNPMAQSLFRAFKVTKDQTAPYQGSDQDSSPSSDKQSKLDAMKRRMSGPT